MDAKRGAYQPQFYTGTSRNGSTIRNTLGKRAGTLMLCQISK